MPMLNIKEIFFKRAAIVFFAGLFIVGCFIFSDYGISCDEPDFSRYNGVVNYNFLSTGDSKELIASTEKYHGPAFEIVLYSVEKFLNVTDSRDIFLLRHGLTFLFFFIATLFFYLLGLKIFKSHAAALLCSVMLVASPRIFAESFYNSKDIVMLCFCIITSYTAFVFIELQTIWWALIHAVCCGFTTDIRIMGLLLPIVTLYLFAMQKQRRVLPVLFFISYTLFFIIAFWPILWLNPIFHFVEAFREMSHFPVFMTTLYFGKIIDCQNLPWHYIPVWISITTPICYLFFFLVGLYFALKNTLTNFSSTLPIQFALFMFTTPILAVIILNSTIYDSYRHIFFVYPFLLLISVYGFIQLFEAVKQKWVIKIISYATILSILSTFSFMIVNHPFQNVYFNFLAGKNIRQNFELDYWGLSYRQGLEYVLANDKSKQIKIAADVGECLLNFKIIPLEDRIRLVWTEDLKSANYYLMNFRWHPSDYNFGTKVFAIYVKKEKIMEVRKLR